ncbi:MAG TPA: amidohydrolase family protein [Chloroflexota bacterium]
MAYDLLIKGGRIVDGSGLPSYLGDVAVQDGRIVAVGRVAGAAERTIDADGLAVAPGFIDPHTHLDAQLLWDPLGTSSCWHGVTSVIMGNCGLTLAPCKAADRDAVIGSFVRVEGMARPALEAGFDWRWETPAQYAQVLGQRLGLNAGFLVGHCAIRQAAMGEDSVERAATPAEIARMQDLIREALDAGALGFSTNQNNRHFREDGKPVPPRLATPEEIEALAGVLTERNAGIFQTTQGGVNQPEDVHRTADLALRVGRPIVWQSILHRWSHPHSWRGLLDAAADAAARGARTYAMTNARPFNNRYTLRNAQEFDEFPTWRALMFAPVEARKAAFRDPDVRAKLRWEAVDDPKPGTFPKRWDLVRIIKVARPEHQEYQGLSVAALAERQGKPVVDAFLDLSLAEDLETLFQHALTNGDDAAVGEILRSPYTVVGQSDAGAHVNIDAGFGYCTLLLGYYVRELGVMSLEEAVRKLTFMVASIFELPGRGLLRPGYAADLVVFDPATVGPCEPEMVNDLPAGEPRLIQRATGIEYTVVNGTVLLEHGEHTGAYPGRVLRRAS